MKRQLNIVQVLPVWPMFQPHVHFHPDAMQDACQQVCDRDVQGL